MRKVIERTTLILILPPGINSHKHWPKNDLVHFILSGKLTSVWKYYCGIKNIFPCAPNLYPLQSTSSSYYYLSDRSFRSLLHSINQPDFRFEIARWKILIPIVVHGLFAHSGVLVPMFTSSSFLSRGNTLRRLQHHWAYTPLLQHFTTTQIRVIAASVR